MRIRKSLVLAVALAAAGCASGRPSIPLWTEPVASVLPRPGARSDGLAAAVRDYIVLQDSRSEDLPPVEVRAERFTEEAPVGEIMTSPLVIATRETTIDECMALMTDRRIRHVPVVDEGKVVGLVSIGDLVKFKSKLQTFEIQFLNDYITAG